MASQASGAERAFLDLTQRMMAERELAPLLDFLFDTFRALIPYDRIGIAVLEDCGKAVRSLWMRSQLSANALPVGYATSLETSSLKEILVTGKPRIIGNLREYLATHPNSASTRRIVEDGILSSLTCPLIAPDGPIGFMFFSSQHENCYNSVHVDIFLLLAGQVSLIVERAARERVLHNYVDREVYLHQIMHDLRNPIGVIRGYADLMLSGSLGAYGEEIKSAIATINRQSETLLNLVSDIQDLSVLSSARFALHKTDHPVNAFFNEFFAASQVLARDKEMKLVMDLDVNLPEVANFDALRIGQVLSNLMSNAFKYSPAKSTVALRARRQGNTIQVSVQDEGQGIPKEEFSKVFKPFGRTSVRPIDHESSTGLGLYICRQIIGAHSGKIWFESESGRGSTFHFTLPVNAGPNRLR